MARSGFGTAINCIDGRVQLPVIGWIRRVLALEYVDLVTEPGPDKVLALGPAGEKQAVRRKVELSVGRHASTVVAIAAHHDCLANPEMEDVHRQLLRQAVDVVLDWDLGVKVVALWVNERWQVDVVVTRSRVR
jgi:hypothetical protein